MDIACKRPVLGPVPQGYHHVLPRRDLEGVKYAETPLKNGSLPNDWVGKCWVIITSSIHDDLYLKLSHVQRGIIPELLQEIRTALLVTAAETVETLRVELYSATMKECSCDLQAYIAFILQRVNKLHFGRKST